MWASEQMGPARQLAQRRPGSRACLPGPGGGRGGDGQLHCVAGAHRRHRLHASGNVPPQPIFRGRRNGVLLARGQLFALLIRPALVGNLCQRLVAGEAEPVRCKSWGRQRQIARQCNACPRSKSLSMPGHSRQIAAAAVPHLTPATRRTTRRSPADTRPLTRSR